MDGRKDLLVGEAEGAIRLYLNINTDDHPLFDGGTLLEVGEAGSKVAIDVGQRTTPIVTDWDNDGRRDLLVGAKDGMLRLFLNTGTDSSWEFTKMDTLQENGADMIVPSFRSSPHVEDLDSDGKKDLLLGNTEGQVLFYGNQGSDEAPFFSGYSLIESDGAPINLGGLPRSRPFVCDWNDDGVKDLLVGSGDGLIRLYMGVDELAGSGGEEGQVTPEAVTLYQNFPNPFNPSTRIVFDITSATHVKLSIYSLKGELVATVADSHMEPGRKEIYWNAKDGKGRILSSGIYFYRLTAGDIVLTRKMVLLR
jgi:hypothetical protein